MALRAQSESSVHALLEKRVNFGHENIGSNMDVPARGVELFDLVRIDKTDKGYDLWLDEKKERSEEDRKNPNIVARGYTDYSVLQDFPMSRKYVVCFPHNILEDGTSGFWTTGGAIPPGTLPRGFSIGSTPSGIPRMASGCVFEPTYPSSSVSLPVAYSKV